MLVKSKVACQPPFEFCDNHVIVTGGSLGICTALAVRHTRQFSAA